MCGCLVTPMFDKEMLYGAVERHGTSERQRIFGCRTAQFYVSGVLLLSVSMNRVLDHFSLSWLAAISAVGFEPVDS